MASVTIDFRVEVYTGFSRAARNRLRKSKILNKLRAIRRNHPTLNFQVQRGPNFIAVEFQDARDLTMFTLLWPADYPRWEHI